MSPADKSETHPLRKLHGDGRFCRKCHYPLSGLESPGHCPECGCDFDFTILYSYEVDAHPPTLPRRVLSRRGLAVLCAVALEALAAWVMWEGDRAAAVLLPTHAFLMSWLLFVATGLDVTMEELGQFVGAAIVISTLTFVPLTWVTGGWWVIAIGPLGGLLAGPFLYRMKKAHWIG